MPIYIQLGRTKRMAAHSEFKPKQKHECVLAIKGKKNEKNKSNVY